MARYLATEVLDRLTTEGGDYILLEDDPEGVGPPAGVTLATRGASVASLAVGGAMSATVTVRNP